MKKISTGRITVITSPEDSSEFRRGGKPNSTSSIQDRRSFFCSIWSGEKNRVFRAGERTPRSFRGIPRKDTLRNQRQKKKKKGAPLAFFLVPATFKLRSPSSPSVFVSLVCLSHYFIFLPPSFLIHRTHSSHPLVSWSIFCSPWSSAGIFPRLLSFIPSRNFFSRNSPFSSGLFSWRTARLRFRVFDYLVYFLEFFPFFPAIGFCFSFDHCSKACVILEVRS